MNVGAAASKCISAERKPRSVYVKYKGATVGL